MVCGVETGESGAKKRATRASRFELMSHFHVTCVTQNRPGGLRKAAALAEFLRQIFRNQKGRIQEEVEGLGHLVLYYPMLHCEPNFIERYWCRAKWFAREDCGYSFEALKVAVPEVLASVTMPPSAASTGWHCVLLILTLQQCNTELKSQSKMYINRIVK